MSIGSRRCGLEQAAHRHRRRRPAATNQIPIGPGPRVEDAWGRVFQHFEIVVLADDAAQCPQIVRGAEHHDVCEELQRVGDRPFRFFEPYDAAGDLQQIGGFWQRLHDATPSSLARRTCDVNTGRLVGSTVSTAARSRSCTSIGNAGTSSK